MFDNFIPDIFEKIVYDINFIKYYNEGFRGIIFDIDNTLVLHNEPCTENCKNFIKELKNIGFKIIILSNNNHERTKNFAEALDIPFINDAKKPKIDNYIKATNFLKEKKENCLFVGDQLFTDIYGAKRAKIKCILVKPLGKEIYLHIKIKRIIEKIVLTIYNLKKQYGQIRTKK